MTWTHASMHATKAVFSICQPQISTQQIQLPSYLTSPRDKRTEEIRHIQPLLQRLVSAYSNDWFHNLQHIEALRSALLSSPRLLLGDDVEHGDYVA